MSALPLNYAPQAIGELRALALDCQRSGANHSAANLVWLAEHIHDAVKFRLPDYGPLFDRDMDRSPFAEFARLPFPEVAAEYWLPEARNERASFETQDAPRRIAFASTDLAWIRTWLVTDDDRIDRALRPAEERGGFFVVPVWYDAGEQRWVSGHTMAIVAYCAPDDRQRFRDKWQRELDKPLIREIVASRDMSKTGNENNYLFTTTFVPFLPEVYEASLQLYGHAGHEARVMLDTADEVRSILDLALAMSCVNYADQVATIPPPAKLNAKRAKRGKSPLYGYSVVGFEAPRTVQANRPHAGGTHASPKFHLRKAHLRRLDGGDRIIFVRAAAINAGAAGRVEQTYEARRAQ